MTPREHARLVRLIERLPDLEPKVKQPDAEVLVGAAAAKYPSLAYWLAYRVILLERMLDSADVQIEFLQRELRKRTAPSGLPPAAPRAAGDPAHHGPGARAEGHSPQTKGGLR